MNVSREIIYFVKYYISLIILNYITFLAFIYFYEMKSHIIASLAAPWGRSVQ